MRAKLVSSSDIDQFNTLLERAISQIDSSMHKVDSIEFRIEYDMPAYRRIYIALITSDIRVNNALISGALLPMQSETGAA